MGPGFLTGPGGIAKPTKLKVAVLTLFPEMFSALTESGISARAIENGLLDLKLVNPREYTRDKHQSVDARPYGGGPGMVMRVAPLKRALNDTENWFAKSARQPKSAARVKRIYLSPQGQPLTRKGVDALGKTPELILVAGRYEGIDERFIEQEIDEEWSIGDYVLSGGELPAMVLLDALIRKIPGSLGDEQSAVEDSFEDGLLDCPHYTRPEVLPEELGVEFAGLAVPEVLISGDHKRIEAWRLQQRVLRTWARRPDMIDRLKSRGEFSESMQALLDGGLQKEKKTRQ